MGAIRHPAVVFHTTTFGAPGRGLAWFPLDRPLGISMARIVESHDHPMGEDAATPAPQASRRPTPRAAALGAQQRAVEHAPRAPAQVAPSEPLAAARELLRNPPELAVSPDVMRQWRDNIDRLIILAQATPGSTGTGSGQRRR